MICISCHTTLSNTSIRGWCNCVIDFVVFDDLGCSKLAHFFSYHDHERDKTKTTVLRPQTSVSLISKVYIRKGNTCEYTTASKIQRSNNHEPYERGLQYWRYMNAFQYRGIILELVQQGWGCHTFSQCFRCFSERRMMYVASGARVFCESVAYPVIS